jgi:hypothetical protein
MKSSSLGMALLTATVMSKKRPEMLEGAAPPRRVWPRLNRLVEMQSCSSQQLRPPTTGAGNCGSRP